MKVDLVQKLRTWKGHALTHVVLAEAADEIERLRAAVAIAAGMLSTREGFTDKHPEEVLRSIMEEARRAR